MRRGGFSLVEISIVLVVISVMISGVLPYITESQKTNATNDTAERLEAIELAMLTFRAANGFIPCPSDITVALNTGAFGTAIASNCGTASFTTAAVAGGGVPTKTLGLSDEYGFDGWGRRLTYHVSRSLTSPGGYSAATGGNIEVRDASNAPRTAVAAYAVVSHGPNGHGAYTRAANQRFNFGSNNTDEHDNATYNAAGAATPAYDNILHQYMATPDDGVVGTADPDGFDDIVRYQIKASLELLVGGGGGAPVVFKVSRAADQSIPNNTATVVDWTTEDANAAGAFNLATNRFQPTTAGWYNIHLNARFSAMPVSGWAWAAIRKNASVVEGSGHSNELENNAASDVITRKATALVYLNGTTDYVDAQVLQNSGAARNLDSTVGYLGFYGHLVK